MAKSFNRDVQRLDLGIGGLRVQQTQGGPELVFDHIGLSGSLPADMESNGTKLFVRIYPLIYVALGSGGIAVIDELDLAVHPMLLNEIIRWFHDPRRNPRGAQLWMTCQNPSLLENLIKEEVFFCEKNQHGATHVYGLSDIKAVRRNENYYSKYLGGVYGAVPQFG